MALIRSYYSLSNNLRQILSPIQLFFLTCSLSYLVFTVSELYTVAATIEKHQTQRSARFCALFLQIAVVASSGRTTSKWWSGDGGNCIRCKLRGKGWEVGTRRGCVCMSNAAAEPMNSRRCNCAFNWVQYLREALGQLQNKRSHTRKLRNINSVHTRSSLSWDSGILLFVYFCILRWLGRKK